MVDFARTVIGVDPAVTSGENADMTGIIVAARGYDGLAYILADLSCRMTPDGWARRVVDAYKRFQADRVIAEINQGGELVERVIRTVDPHISFTGVHAKKGKHVRAEPIAALYEQGKVFHADVFMELEDQMCMFTPDNFEGSPDRVDALVWALTELMLGEGSASFGSADFKSPKRFGFDGNQDDDD